MSRKRSGKGFWAFLKIKKTPLPEAETPKEQDALETPEEGSFDALFSYLDVKQRDAEVESSIAPPESSEEIEDRELQSCAWEISEEAEVQEQEPLEKTEIPDSGERALESRKLLEKLRVLEENVVSLESCIAERLNSNP